MSSTLVSTTHPNHQRLHSMSEDYRGFPGLEYHSLAAHFGHSVQDESLPMLIDLPHLFLCEEGLPAARDLEARRDFPTIFREKLYRPSITRILLVAWREAKTYGTSRGSSIPTP